MGGEKKHPLGGGNHLPFSHPLIQFPPRRGSVWYSLMAQSVLISQREENQPGEGQHTVISFPPKGDKEEKGRVLGPSTGWNSYHRFMNG